MKHSLPCRALRKRPMKLGTTVILMVSAVLFSVLVVVHLIYFSQISSMTRDALADKALAVARSLADSPAVREGLKKPPAESGIQTLAEAVSQHNGFLFIVVTNMQGIRYSHQKRSESANRSKAMTFCSRCRERKTLPLIAAFLPKRCAFSHRFMMNTTGRSAW
ncbi:two-component sensor kinase [Salmonella enterica subsp. enterica serovar Typhimurium]|nr:two-component sensor kinase [Salmonella enterica subsp. enterica serovar Typhimurium]